MSKVAELFGRSAESPEVNWRQVVDDQLCPFTTSSCFKVRKSEPSVAIGTCSVRYGGENQPVAICPNRFLERGQVFRDCIGLLSQHRQGNQLHVVPEVSIPGGSVDFFLVSTDGKTVDDFVGIEFQTMDTTGTVWPDRQHFLRERGLLSPSDVPERGTSFGMNWKMTAKTILVQMHHKSLTFEHVKKKLVLVIQDRLLEYMQREFNFGSMRQPAASDDPVRFHAYRMAGRDDTEFEIELATTLSTDDEGIAACLGLQAEARIELSEIHRRLLKKLGPNTAFPVE